VHDHASVFGHTTSAGHAQSDAAWLDAHFETCRPEYEAMLRSVGIQPGWSVLDAGCGGGNFLPLLAALVGPSGRLTALDLAPEHIVAFEAHRDGWAHRCPVETHVGSVTDLPFPDRAFDAVWCANTAQYLRDDELRAALAEFRRVVRPGGTVAVKDAEPGHTMAAPADPFLVSRVTEALSAVSEQMRHALRGRTLRRWPERAGFVDVWQRTSLVERWAPLRPVERAFLTENFALSAAAAEHVPLWDTDRAFFRTLRDPDAPVHILNYSEFYWCEGHVLAVGRVPNA
jgi:ubiquinone/menaquinone biosynthesis C-methylase UbiE